MNEKRVTVNIATVNNIFRLLLQLIQEYLIMKSLSMSDYLDMVDETEDVIMKQKITAKFDEKHKVCPFLFSNHF